MSNIRFQNDDEQLRSRAKDVLEERSALGLDGVVGDLECIVIHTEPDRLVGAARGLLDQTGYRCSTVFETPQARTCVLTCADSADILVQSRVQGDSAFSAYNRAPKAAHLPHTRLETYVFACSDVARYVQAQRKRGTVFLTEEPVTNERYRFIQTVPSRLTGHSIGVVEWRGRSGAYRPENAAELALSLSKPDRDYLARIGTLDHIATRVRAEDRDPAILEFMGLTGYSFDFAIYVPSLNSITNVARLEGARFALVFTSGIEARALGERLGPTEQFVENYGARAHHMAFCTEEIEATDRALRTDGVEFLSELVGEPAGGIQQSFTKPSPDTLLVNEYIHRFGDFDGFFTPGNVTRLTEATRHQ